jgi:hypothetical protein
VSCQPTRTAVWLSRVGHSFARHTRGSAGAPATPENLAVPSVVFPGSVAACRLSNTLGEIGHAIPAAGYPHNRDRSTEIPWELYYRSSSTINPTLLAELEGPIKICLWA